MNNNTQEIKFSFIVPCYNVESYIEESLDTLINQSYKNFEIIIINDGSTDNTLTIATKYSKNYLNIKIINQEHSGPSASRNAGLSVANGQYIVFVDSDDFVDKDLLLNLYNTIKQNTTADIIIFDYFKYKQIEKKAKLLTKIKEYKQKLQPNFLYSNTVEHKKLLLKTSIVAWNKCYSLKFLKTNNLVFLNGCVYEDIPFLWQIILLSNNVVYLNKSLYYYRQRSLSIMSKTNDIKYIVYKEESLIKVFNYLNNFLINNNFFSLYYQDFNKKMLKTFIKFLHQSKNKKAFFYNISKAISTVNLNNFVFTIKSHRLFEYYLIKKRLYIVWRFLYKWF